MKEEIKDKFGIVYFIFVLLGSTTLLPFNVFMTEKEFYDVRLHSAPYDPYVASNFMGLFALSYNTLNILSLGLLIKYQRLLSLRVLVLQPMVIAFIVLASTAALALRVDVPGDLMARFTIPSIGLMGLCAALLAGGTLQLASIFSPVHIQAVVSGIAIGGVVTSSLSFFAQLSGQASADTPTPEDVAPVAFKYFTASAAVVASSIIGYSILPFLPYGRYKLLLAGIIDDPKERKMLTTDEDYEEPLLTVVEGAGAGTSSGSRTESVTRAAIISVETDHTQASRSWQFHHAFSIYCVTLFFCMLASIAFHPGISSFVCSVHNPAQVSPCAPQTEYGRWAGDLFVPLIFVLFSVGDWLGRTLSVYGPWGRGPPKPLSILTYSLVRCALATGILFCNVASPHHWLLPKLLQYDAAPLGIILLLGLSQGHLISTICMHAPGTLLPNSQSLFGPVTSFAISLGAFIGSFVNIALASSFQDTS